MVSKSGKECMSGDVELAFAPKRNLLAHDIKSQEKQGRTGIMGQKQPATQAPLGSSSPPISISHWVLGLFVVTHC